MCKRSKNHLAHVGRRLKETVLISPEFENQFIEYL